MPSRKYEALVLPNVRITIFKQNQNWITRADRLSNRERLVVEVDLIRTLEKVYAACIRHTP